jgi:integrase
MPTFSRFTDKFVASLRPTEKEYWVREGHGFAIRVLPSGEKVWYYIYTFDHRKRYMRLFPGGYPGVALADARKAFDAAKVKVQNGLDPLEEDRTAREERRKAPLVGDLVQEYIEKHAKRFKRSWAKDQAILNRDVIPAWGDRKAVDIVKRDVILLLEQIIERGAPGMANNCFQIVRKMFNFAVERDILPFSPCTGAKLPAPKKSRDRVLSEEEIRNLWGNLDQAGIADATKRGIKLTLVTAQRPGEVIGMHRGEIDGRWWTIPAERAKNGKAHRVYLSDLALYLIGETKGYIFPCPHHAKEQPIGGNAMVVALKRNRKMLGIEEHFTPHDLRRTAATNMAESGAMDEVIDAILNHAKQGVIRVYNQYRYDKEKQLTLESWARKLEGIVADAAVAEIIPMQRKTA